ncbi:MAG: indole-3-glycerol phosphate synthase TrpC [Acidobacteriia bacterium]|nr:indole-3-glycerol phosphate synthase TrpC [Terriglobia bacterium]
MSRPAAGNGSVLDAIAAATRRRLDAARREIAPEALRAAALRARFPRGFARVLGAPAPWIVAEVKLASPSHGRLGTGVSPMALAEAYFRGGAAAISVLTEPKFFGGGFGVLDAVRRRVPLPLLMKDFVLDEYQLWQARLHGADGVLLIAALLGGRALGHLVDEATDLGLTPLVEVHDEAEMDAALLAGARLVGVNNRDLRTLRVDLAVSRRLASRRPPDGVTFVSESGIRSRREIDELANLGYRGFLVGTHLVRSADPAAGLAGLLDGRAGGGARWSRRG